MNAFEFGFYDELEKIAAQEMYKVRPEVSKQIAADIRDMWNEDVLTRKELPRKEGQKNTEVRFTAGRTNEDLDFERPGDAEIIAKHRKHIANQKGELLRGYLRRRASLADRQSPGWYKETHLPGFGRHEPGYNETLPDGSLNPWGSKLQGPTPRPPMPQPVKR